MGKPPQEAIREAVAIYGYLCEFVNCVVRTSDVGGAGEPGWPAGAKGLGMRTYHKVAADSCRADSHNRDG
jgi:hypothetical protein